MEPCTMPFRLSSRQRLSNWRMVVILRNASKASRCAVVTQ